MMSIVRCTRSVSQKYTRSQIARAMSSAESGTVVDIHTHFLPHSWPNFHKKFGDEYGPWPWMRYILWTACVIAQLS